MMKLNISPAPYPGAPVVVLSAGLGGAGGYWLPQRSALEAHYQLVSYDHNGTGENGGPLPAGYSMAQMAQELYAALLEAGIGRFALVGHALGALIGLQLALDHPEAISALVLVNGWLTLSPHTRRCFLVRERLLHAGGAQAWPPQAISTSWLSGIAACSRREQEAGTSRSSAALITSVGQTMAAARREKSACLRAFSLFSRFSLPWKWLIASASSASRRGRREAIHSAG